MFTGQLSYLTFLAAIIHHCSSEDGCPAMDPAMPVPDFWT